MASCEIVDVVVKNNPCFFQDPFLFDITLDCLQPLEEGEDLEWKMVYVGCPKDSSRDQVLSWVELGPVAVGRSKFELRGDPPNHALIAPEDLLGVTVVLLTCSYKVSPEGCVAGKGQMPVLIELAPFPHDPPQEQEFIRIGYYLNNELHVANPEEPPQLPPHPHEIRRDILQNKPRVTRFWIDWGGAAPVAAPAIGSVIESGDMVEEEVMEEPMYAMDEELI